VGSGFFRNSLVYLLILAAVAALIFTVFDGSGRPEQKDITEIAALIKANKVKSITVRDDELTVELRDQADPVLSRKERGVNVFESLINLGIGEEALRTVDEIEVASPGVWDNWVGIGVTVLPLLVFGGLLFFMVRQAQGSNNQALSFGKSRARMFTADKPSVTFEDVAGADESKQELSEVVEFLREPEKFISLGARIPKGVLMVGPPGCGKTLLAKAVAGEAGVPFFSISGSEFVEMFVGVGASRVRDLFEQAKRNSPCIVFVDEIDAVGRHRGAGLGGSHDEREQTLNQILVEMDGFDTDTNVIVVAATNRPDILDPALLRPGRFDRQVVLDRPDWMGREKILVVHTRGKPLAPDVNLETLAKATIGFVGADLENVVNEAAILAARRNKKHIAMGDMQDAIEKVLLGPERRSRMVTEREKKIVAYHEAGHALAAQMIKEADPVHKVTIIPRGMAGGVTWFLPEDDRTMAKRSHLEARLVIALGGRVAEEVVFGEITTGARADLQSVTNMARTMVTRYGMSERLGPVTFGEKEELVFLGREIGEQRNYGEEVARMIDEEVKRFVDKAHVLAREVISRYRPKLDEIAHRLLEEETIDGPDFAAMFGDLPPESVVSLSPQPVLA
jgi:cell division protease FtsH